MNQNQGSKNLKVLWLIGVKLNKLETNDQFEKCAQIRGFKSQFFRV
jgi:hypothetical protein